MAQVLSGGGSPAGGAPSQAGPQKPKSPKWGLGEGKSSLGTSHKMDRINEILNIHMNKGSLVPPLPEGLEKLTIGLSEVVKLLGEPKNHQKLLKASDVLDSILDIPQDSQWQEPQTSDEYSKAVKGLPAVYDQLCSLMRRSTHSGIQRRLREIERKFTTAGWGSGLPHR